MSELTLGYSSCPNDTFIFYALVHGLLDTGGMRFLERHEDVETLNRLASDCALDITKVSYGAMPGLIKDYVILRSGGALGRGCGPLLVTKREVSLESLRGARIAVPGLKTTAYLLMRLMDPDLAANALPMQFDRIMPAVVSGEADAGLIIHEGRFTFEGHGLKRLVDLGEWWEATTAEPIPLGCIIMKRSLGMEAARRAQTLVRKSIEYAVEHPGESASYIKRHSQELADEVIHAHIGLYVNEFSLEVGYAGERAVRRLMGMASERGLAPGLDASMELFAPGSSSA